MLSKSRERAEFATVARILSCLVTESLVSAFYLPLEESESNVAGFAVALTHKTSSDDSLFESNHILAIVPLHHDPVFEPNGVLDVEIGKRIGLLDPLDMVPLVFETHEAGHGVHSNEFIPEVMHKTLPSHEILMAVSAP